jgi:3-hydroxyisobutyrate dehydrogenase-like beta-hydroxyacid dehydrogenase
MTMKIAFIGTGLMGRPMAERLAKANYELVFYTRTLEKAEPLRSLGARISKTAQGAVKSSDCVVVMLSDISVIQDVLFRAWSG